MMYKEVKIMKKYHMKIQKPVILVKKNLKKIERWNIGKLRDHCHYAWE